jgi:transcriptional regulator with XRE-family HTH domain
MDDIAAAFGVAIEHLRGGRRQAECAAHAGIHRASWSLYEAGKRMPRAATRERIAAGLGVSRRRLEEEALDCLRASTGLGPDRPREPSPRQLDELVAELCAALGALLAYLVSEDWGGLRR